MSRPASIHGTPDHQLPAPMRQLLQQFVLLALCIQCQRRNALLEVLDEQRKHKLLSFPAAGNADDQQILRPQFYREIEWALVEATIVQNQTGVRKECGMIFIRA